MNHSVSTDVFGCEYLSVQRNKASAMKALDAMAPKPIKKMGPMDYSAKNIPPSPLRNAVTKEDAVVRERDCLRQRCLVLLRALGAQTTAQLARETKKSGGAVRCALNGTPGVMKEQGAGARNAKTGNVSRITLWMLPIARQ